MAYLKEKFKNPTKLSTRQRSFSCGDHNINNPRNRKIATVEDFVQCPHFFTHITDIPWCSSNPATLSVAQRFWIAGTVLQRLRQQHDEDGGGYDFQPHKVFINRNGAVLKQRDRSPLNQYEIRQHHDETVRALLYTAPEDLRGDSTSRQLSDIWSFACLCLYIFTERDPEFYKENKNGEKVLLNRAKNAFTAITLLVGDGICPPGYAEHFQRNPEMLLFFRDCFQFSSSSRPSAALLSQRLLSVHRTLLLKGIQHMTGQQLEIPPTSPAGLVASIAETFHGKAFTFTSGNDRFRYVALKEVSKGSFGEVFEASEQMNDKPTGRSVAIKQSFYRGISNLSEFREKMENNHVRIKRITNPHVTSYHHVKMEESVGLSLTVIITMEYGNLGNLENFTKTHKLSNGEIKDIIKQVLSGLVAIHEQGIIHTDLKTANIVLASDTHFAYGRVVKITDLDDHVGLASTVTRVNEVADKRRTIIFMSPEMLTGGHNGYLIGRRTDVWSMGCVIVELYRKGKDLLFVKKMTGINTPVEMLNAHRAREGAICSFITTGGKPEIPEDIPALSRTMVQKCFEMDPEKRISASELLQSGWFEEPTVVKTNQAPGISRMEFTLSNGERIPPPDDDLKWDVRIACAARVLMHHMNTTRFPYQHPRFYRAEVDLVRKVIEPRQSLDPKFQEWMAKLLDTQGPIAHSLNPVTRLIHMIVQPTGPRMSALLTTFLPTIGPSFPVIAEWMNRYTTDHQYVCKSHASWSDIKTLIDKKEPVIAQVRLYDLPMGDMVRTIAEMVGMGEHCPPTFPYICAKILRGYEGRRANGEPATVIYTNPEGKTGIMEFEEFRKEADWTPSHPLLKEVFDLAGYEPGQIIYRVGKNVTARVANLAGFRGGSQSRPARPTEASTDSPDPITHIVEYGDTLSAIGVKYGVPYMEIAKDNNIADMNKIAVGTKLKIIRSRESDAQVRKTDMAAKPVGARDSELIMHTLQYGETLSTIGLKYGVPYVKIARDNNIADPNKLRVGKKLKIIRTSGSEKASPQARAQDLAANLTFHYTVKYGDTLAELAARYHLPHETIIEDNAISDPTKIYVGMQLKIRLADEKYDGNAESSQSGFK